MRRVLVLTAGMILLAAAAGCIKIFGLGPSLEQAAGALGRALGVEFVMQRAPEQVHSFDRWVSRGGPPILEAIGPAKGPAMFSLQVALDSGSADRLQPLLDLIMPEWEDRRAWLRSALHKLTAAEKDQGRIRLRPSTNRIVVLVVDKKAARATLTLMTLLWEDHAGWNKQRQGGQAGQ